MSVRILINNSQNPNAEYIGWSPSLCKIRVTDGLPRTVVLQNKMPAPGGQVVFTLNGGGTPQNFLQLNLPANGTDVDFFIGARFNPQTNKAFSSINGKDAVIEVIDRANNSRIGEKSFMVRVRKNANELTVGERDRFLSALVRLNSLNQPNRPNGKFVDFQNMHNENASREIHGRSCFLPWHRAMILDLERRLQEIDPGITMPYWKFDQPAPRVFHRDFMGWPLSSGIVDFSSTNPLINWRLRIFGEGDGNMRIRRTHRSSRGIVWDPTTQRAAELQNDEAQTMRLSQLFQGFRRPLEQDPHGSAHISFTGQLSDIGRAPADPLFFLLHTNIDRLWAKWQWSLRDTGFRYNSADPRSYPNQGVGQNRQGEGGIGDCANDSIWPWNGIFGIPRPTTAPGGPFPPSPLTANPGVRPVISSFIDFQGNHSLRANLMFAYDDVPFQYQ